MGGLLTQFELQLVFYAVVFFLGMGLKQPIVDWVKGVPKEMRSGMAAAEAAAMKRMHAEALKIVKELEGSMAPRLNNATMLGQMANPTGPTGA